ncbi:Alpha/beta hydrolase family protein [Legionella massiliensis]|uniref:Alpha/beta hydrolase family protein n=1 Tax=Legionella massiliensis TaxID=1034943 RepID=A0A078KNH7_9GAMM|nr:membrane protein [Legionella massiliensis]CDZ75905.1 Alpha/beta hydrolase family protein [Legionella massiliensis]CEE11643.1 Alpha/beta hydrolase family protein [Legionella massiliensis]
MFPSDKLATVGEHFFFFAGLAGQLEAVLTVPPEANKRFIALLGHPHSLQGGTMNNKVVTTMARAFKELAIPSIRFNFRGVGQSEGSYDAGIGESEDMLALMHLCQQEIPAVSFIFAGFSFGSYVAYRAAAQREPALLITIAPPVHHYDYLEFTPPKPWIIFQGDEDDVSPLELVHQFAEGFSPVLPLIRFADTGHFFHGKLLELKAGLVDAVKSQVSTL